MSSILHSPTTAPGRFGPYGGRYVPETLMVPLFEFETRDLTSQLHTHVRARRAAPSAFRERSGRRRGRIVPAPSLEIGGWSSWISVNLPFDNSISARRGGLPE